MKVDSLIWVQFLALVALCMSSAGRSAVPKDPFLGISPQDESYYKVSSDTIKCKDGSGKFSKAQLNDDFCDCADSTDEPGTSACPGGKFYCRNAGHSPIKIFSSRVNDGICDCCDGSDEYDGQVNCPNTCWEAGKVARDKLRKKIATYKEGATIRKKEVEEAKRAIAKDEAELAKLKSEESVLKGLVQQLKDRKEQIEKAEERERLQKEKEEKERKEAEEKSDKVESGGEDKDEDEDEAKQGTVQTEDTTDNEDKSLESINDEIGLLDDTPPNKDVSDVEFESSSTEGSPVNGMEQLAAKEHEESASPGSKDDAVVVSENGDDVGTKESHEQMKGENDLSTSTEGLSKEELGRHVASRWTGSSAKKTEESESTQHNEHGDSDEISQDTHDEEDDGYNSETDNDSGKYDDGSGKYDDDTGKYDDADVEDIEETYEEDVHDDAGSSYKSDDEIDFSDTNSQSGLSWLEKIQQTVRNLVQAVNFFQAPVDKSEADHIRKEYEESNTKLTKMQSRISTLTQKLKHDYGKEKEFYSFYDRCFESKQNKYVYKVCPFKQASQVEGHATTRLGRWEKFEDSYRSMIFANGDKCWNGPDRSMKVKLRCGLTNVIADVDEPSRCEYIALLSTPTLCLEEKLKELEDKLELMEKPQPQIHDEL